MWTDRGEIFSEFILSELTYKLSNVSSFCKIMHLVYCLSLVVTAHINNILVHILINITLNFNRNAKKLPEKCGFGVAQFSQKTAVVGYGFKTSPAQPYSECSRDAVCDV